MKIETATIARLRDALLQSGRREAVVQTSAYETLTREGLLSEEEDEAMKRVEPLAETMFLVMAADGHLSNAERDAVRGALRGLTGDLLHAGTINVMLERFQEHLDSEGRERRLEQIAAAIKDDESAAEGAFALASAVALADNQVASEEEELIRRLATWFEISAERQRAILDDLQDDSNAAQEASRGAAELDARRRQERAEAERARGDSPWDHEEPQPQRPEGDADG